MRKGWIAPPSHEVDWAAIYQSLCEAYHWSPYEIDQLTLPELKLALYRQPAKEDASQHLQMKLHLSPEERLSAMRMVTI